MAKLPHKKNRVCRVVEYEEQQSALIRRAIDIGTELVRVCDHLDLTLAGNHITYGLDILAVAADIAAAHEQSVELVV